MFGNQVGNGNTRRGSSCWAGLKKFALFSAHTQFLLLQLQLLLLLATLAFILHHIMSTVRFDLAAFPTKQTIKMLTNILVKITRTNDRLCSTTAESDKDQSNQHSPLYTCFHARSIPTIDIHSYLSRILKYTPCANEVRFVSLSRPVCGSLIVDLRLSVARFICSVTLTIIPIGVSQSPCIF
jgi:hypothetical protein